MIEAGDDTFEREVLAAEGTVLVDFSATWCPPCRVLEPILEALAREGALVQGRALKVVHVDVDAAPRTAQRCGVRAAPTLVVYRDGDKRATHVGALPREKILKLVER